MTGAEIRFVCVCEGAVHTDRHCLYESAACVSICLLSLFLIYPDGLSLSISLPSNRLSITPFSVCLSFPSYPHHQQQQHYPSPGHRRKVWDEYKQHTHAHTVCCSFIEKVYTAPGQYNNRRKRDVEEYFHCAFPFPFHVSAFSCRKVFQF